MDIEALLKLTHGMYVVSSVMDDRYNGMTADAVMQVSAEPPLVALAINKDNLTHDYIQKSHVLAISILARDAPMELVGRFGFRSGRDTDKFDGLKYRTGTTGAPILTENVVAYCDARVISIHDVGTHTVFFCLVVESEMLDGGDPMSYGYYRTIKKGKVPERAPTAEPGKAGDSATKKEEKEMSEGGKYVCKICGYVYDPENGDPDNGVDPGTSFENLPENWVCPVCGVGKEEFEAM